MKTAGIVGAGIMGRLLALELLKREYLVTLFDSGDKAGTESCSFVAAGMLSPLSEIETAETLVFEMGLESMRLWDAILAELKSPVYSQRRGSLLLAHSQDHKELDRIKQRFETKLGNRVSLQWLAPEEIKELEPGLSHWPLKGLFIPLEGHLDNRQVLLALGEAIEVRGAEWLDHTKVSAVEPGRIVLEGAVRSFDLVLDCRGLGAKEDIPDLRGVRGELIHVHAPEVALTRPVRLLHPRYRIYIVPRQDNSYVIGASQLESEDLSPISVRTVLELLSAAYSVHPGFAEGRVTGTYVQCRPAFPDNLPRISAQDGLIRVNGLYRHGFLLAPTVVNQVLSVLGEDGERSKATEKFETYQKAEV